MTVFGPLGFAAPWLLLALAALPALWFLMRASPPAPIRRRFPAVTLLLGLKDEDAQAERTPWPLLLLRLLAVAAAIVAFAGPVWRPDPVAPASGPLLILEDGSWASARDWTGRIDRIRRALDAAGAAGRPVALISLASPPPAAPAFTDAATLAQGLPGLTPAPWEPGDLAAALKLLPEGAFDTLWLSDGLDRPGRAALAEALSARGRLTVRAPAAPVLALGPPAPTDAGATLTAQASAPLTADADVAAIGPDPSGVERELARATARFDGGQTAAAVFDLPAELRNRITRFQIVGQQDAGAVALTDDSVKRRKVALIGPAGGAQEGLELLSPLHYLREALAPSADLIEGDLADALTARPDVIILADAPPGASEDALLNWVRAGGALIRFAGPRLIAAETAEDSVADPLSPAPLRAGGRSVGGAMSWGAPRGLAPFPDGSPFAGLPVPDDVTVREQAMAEPGPDLAARTIAALSDGTPLVTRATVGQGTTTLFHVTANAEWSSLPLSGLFPAMLSRLIAGAGRGGASGDATDLAGQTWVPARLIDAYGRIATAEAAAGAPGEALARGAPGPDLPPGVYVAGDRSVALDALARGRVLTQALWPAHAVIEGEAAAQETPLKGALLFAAIALLLLDALATLAVAGRLRARARGGAALIAALVAGAALLGALGRAQAEETRMPIDRAIEAASNVVLAYVPSGDAQVDRASMAGLKGLSAVLAARTAVEPSDPMQLDLATDDLSLFTLIYWPVTPEAPTPTPDEYLRLNRFLRGGGMILFDTRDADLVDAGAETDAGRRLRALAAPLDIPPLDVIAPDHVLTRTFYLLQSFPGRYDGPIWVEAPPENAARADGMPFRNLNDGVTPVVIGGNDWASAWAINDDGTPMFPIGRGEAGERQREAAYRFGVNLMMHVLTGNYKSDQVHVPALLERLGQ